MADPAPLPHLRLGRRRQVDPDRPACSTIAARCRRTSSKGSTDFSLLADGLEAEREQGITIDVAYLYFATRRSAASSSPTRRATSNIPATWRPAPRNAELAIVLVDASKGVLTQTRRHATIARLLGIRSFVLAVNKMDLVGFDRGAVRGDPRRFRRLRARGRHRRASPPSRSRALDGDNVTGPSPRTPWYDGPALLPFLEAVEPERGPALAGLPHAGPAGDPRGRRALLCRHDRQPAACGPATRSSSRPAGTRAEVARIATMDGDLDRGRGRPVGRAQLRRRGGLLARRHDRRRRPPPQVADQFEATLIWMAEEPLLPGRQYLLKLGTQTVARDRAGAQIQARHRHDGAARGARRWR